MKNKRDMPPLSSPTPAPTTKEIRVAERISKIEARDTQSWPMRGKRHTKLAKDILGLKELLSGSGIGS